MSEQNLPPDEPDRCPECYERPCVCSLTAPTSDKAPERWTIATHRDCGGLILYGNDAVSCSQCGLDEWEGTGTYSTESVVVIPASALEHLEDRAIKALDHSMGKHKFRVECDGCHEAAAFLDELNDKLREGRGS